MSVYARGSMELLNLLLFIWKVVNFFVIVPWLATECTIGDLLALHVIILSYDIFNRISQVVDGLVSFAV
jgi:hypothetical protein